MSTAKKKIISDPASLEALLVLFSRTTEEIISLEEFKKLLLSGRQLRFKYGVDVTAPDLHMGHAVNLWMYRKLQEFGHKVIFLIGDFTTQIGDPSGRNKLRPIIPLEDIRKNTKEFMRQALLVLHKEPAALEIRKNSEWYDKMPVKQLLSLMSMVTHDRLMSRDMFRARIQEGKEIYEHELVYPLLQGYDSVMLKADATIIGSDQLYNEMMGRFFQEKFRQPAQVVITTKITHGLDGKEKQSKSLGNYVGLTFSPREKFGKIMTLLDSLIIEYFKVYTDLSLSDIARIEKDSIPSDPMKAKLRLAWEVVKRYHGETSADQEREWFTNTFSKKETPADIPSISIPATAGTVFDIVRACFSQKEKSNSDIRRLITQRGVTIGDVTPSDPPLKISPLKKGTIIKIGKRHWFRVR
ncbi:tyrosine--tRNA ligase [Candidatus Uhrbacteria bacterium]|nr:tyrosine--tRNA ligase [Candidatus Uhrbacteria bacterium]